jgi:hypothetical protein
MKRHRIRIQPYLSPQAHQKLRAYTRTKSLTESAVVDAAVSEYMDRDGVKQDLIVRRLDELTNGLTVVRHEVGVVGMALANLAVYLFHSLPAGGQQARAAAEGRYKQLLEWTGKQIRAGIRLSGEVGRASGPTASLPQVVAASKGGQ